MIDSPIEYHPVRDSLIAGAIATIAVKGPKLVGSLIKRFSTKIVEVVEVADEIDRVIEAVEEDSGAGLDKELMNELAESGVKYNADDVVMITKNSDGKLLWLKKGNGLAGLKHIVDGHAANFTDKGITDIPSFLNQILQSTPVNTGVSGSGLFADYLINGSTYRVAYGTNGFIVSFYPIK